MSYCISPYKKENSTISFPCGSCLDCRKRRASSWGFRLSEQLKISKTAYFLTLTYDTDNIPFTKRERTTLSKKDVQNFFKQLRKKQPNGNIKYYLAAEYGGTYTMRPHYHIIIFNMNLSTLITSSEAYLSLSRPELYLNGKHQFNSSLWKKGYISIGTVTHSSSMYTLKYLSKPKRVPQYKSDDRQPEFSLISKGIGESYLSEQIKTWHLNDPVERMYVNFQHYKIAMPRYYKERLYTQSQRETIAEAIINKIKNKRKLQRLGTSLSERIKYINKNLSTIQNKIRILNKTTIFAPTKL